MNIWNRLVRWVGADEVENVDDAALDAVYERRFRHADRARFIRLWREVARIVRVSPLELGEDDVLAVLASDASRFPHTVMDQLADLATEESTGVPDQTLTTVGELMDWLLARSR
jgi:hypothetical protein